MIATLFLLASSIPAPLQAYDAPMRLDAASPGFRIEHVVPISSVAQSATLAGDDVVMCDGTTVALVDLASGASTTLATLPAFVYPSFVVLEPDLAHAIVGESSNHDLLRVDLASGAVVPIANLQNNFAALVEDPGHLLVSASIHGIFAPNEILRVDLPGGASTKIVEIAGPSGPIARAANGDLYYGEQTLSAPPGSIRILRWTKAQIDSGALLGAGDASVFASGFDGVASLAFDPVTGHLLVAESRFPGPSAVHELDATGARIATVLSGTNWFSALEIVPENGSGSLHAFQPRGLALRYLSTDFTSAGPAHLTLLRPRRPVATTSGPGVAGSGIVNLRIDGAHPNASVFVVRAPVSSWTSPESVFPFGDFLLHTGLAPSAFSGGGVWLPTDAQGRARATFAGPGVGAISTVVQALAADPAGVFAGASSAAFY